MKIAVVLGTRPEIIKLAPIVRELERKKVDFFLFHINQHYPFSPDGIFTEQLNYCPPKINRALTDRTSSGYQGKRCR